MQQQHQRNDVETDGAAAASADGSRRAALAHLRRCGQTTMTGARGDSRKRTRPYWWNDGAHRSRRTAGGSAAEIDGNSGLPHVALRKCQSSSDEPVPTQAQHLLFFLDAWARWWRQRRIRKNSTSTRRSFFAHLAHYGSFFSYSRDLVKDAAPASFFGKCNQLQRSHRGV